MYHKHKFNFGNAPLMALSLERIIWYDFNGFLHVEIVVEEPFFPAKKLLDKRWEEVGATTYFMVALTRGHDMRRYNLIQHCGRHGMVLWCSRVDTLFILTE